jgi:hypothetical protein
MARKKEEIIRGDMNNISTLTGKRKDLFENMRKLYPKGKKEAQISMCIELEDKRVDYYLNNIFNLKNKI